MSLNADALITARWVIPVLPRDTVLEHYAVAVANGVIIDVLPSNTALERYPATPAIDLPDHALIPGLINLHTHTAMTLMRGLADDLPLMTWLHGHIWPVESRIVNADFVRDGALLACAEMLRGGITCFNDMYFFPEATAQAALQAGMRAAIGMIAVEFPSAYASDATDYLAKGMALRDSLRDESLLSFCLAPHAPYTVSDATFERIAIYAAELDVPVHTHLHETQDEIRDSLTAHGIRPIQRLKNFGLLGPNLIAVHAVHLTPEEITLLAEHGCHVAHCPSSNLKLASGHAPIHALLQAGVNVGLGTDSAASNNRLDLLSELRLAALLGKLGANDAAAIPARQALEMATINAARALGMEAKIGSLEIGKRADITAINLGAPELAPCYQPLSHIAYSAGREHVSHVWIDGVLRVCEGQLTSLDSADIVARAASWRNKIMQVQS
ncbi:MAG TPA: TRZ/ATZ family hydrolase [Burkholderiales bacterium]|nr:TRZ/ATZ family hydrolase [Burkholderiales bacterium]